MSETELQRKLVIFVIINNAVDNKRLAIARALRADGHRVHICNKPSYAEIAAEIKQVANQHRIDLVLTFSWSFIHCGGRPFNIPEFRSFWPQIPVPIVVLWDDNPLRWIKIVVGASKIQPRITHFVIDSSVVDRLREESVSARYFPIYYVDPEYMTGEKLDFAPDVDVLLCGNIADTAQFLQLLPGRSDIRYQAAMRFLEMKNDQEGYVDEPQFVLDQSLELSAIDQPLFLAILTGIQRTVDRTRILRKIPQGIRAGLIGHNLSAPEIPSHVTKYPGVSHAAIGHVYALPILQFGTSGWPAACNLRLFQAAAMGGMMLHEDRPDVRRHFSPEADSFLYSDTDHLIEVIEDVLVHREKYRAVAVETKRRFDAEHTVMHRARQLAAMMRQA